MTQLTIPGRPRPHLASSACHPTWLAVAVVLSSGCAASPSSDGEGAAKLTIVEADIQLDGLNAHVDIQVVAQDADAADNQATDALQDTAGTDTADDAAALADGDVGDDAPGDSADVLSPHACTVDVDCDATDDGNKCNGVQFCDKTTQAWSCRPKLGSAVTCTTKGTPCAPVQCVPASGACAPVAVADGTACDDADACTKPDACTAGVCAGTKLTCNDNNPCTVDQCDAAKGCSNSASQAACDDGNKCTEKDNCATSSCAGVAVV